MPLILKPASNAFFSVESIVPLLHTACVLSDFVTSITLVASMSSKLSVPFWLRSCAAASVVSVKPKSAIAPVIVGASFVPVMVTLTCCVELPVPSFTDTSNCSTLVSPCAKYSTADAATV